MFFSVGVRVIVCLHFVLKIMKGFLKLLGFLFQCFDALIHFGMLVSVRLACHERSSKAQRILAPSSRDFKPKKTAQRGEAPRLVVVALFRIVTMAMIVFQFRIVDGTLQSLSMRPR